MPFGDGTGPRNRQYENTVGQRRWLKGGIWTNDAASQGQGRGQGGRARLRACSPGTRPGCRRNRPDNA